MIPVIHHRGQGPVHFTKYLFSYYNHVYSCSPYIFLSPCINKIKLIEINLAAQDITAHISNQWHLIIIKKGKVLPLCSVDSIIAGYVQVFCSGSYTKSFWKGTIHGFFSAADYFHMAKQLCFFNCLGCPYACICIGSHFIFTQQIHGYLEKLGGCTSMKK